MESREDAALLLAEAASRIQSEADPRLIPEGGIRMGYVLPGASAVRDVCTMTVNCAEPSAEPSAVCWGKDAGADAGPDAEFDADAARILLTVIRHEPCLRFAVRVRCTEEILRCATDDCAFDAVPYPSAAPPGSGTMDWGVEACCRDGVPDIIYGIKNGQRTEEEDLVLWIITETPADGARNLIMLSGCISYTSL